MLNFKLFIKEAKEHHVHIAFMGASPNTHMGHNDVFDTMGKHGQSFVGLSGKSTVFSDSERSEIASRQTGGKIKFKVEKTAGQTIGRAWDSLGDKPGKRVLHIHAGGDRAEMAEGLKKSVEAGKIPELNGGKFDEVHIHYPENVDRPHGLSGTKMRAAAVAGDLETYHKHVGKGFSKEEAKKMMDRTQEAIKGGSLPLKRK
jgi:hypothetical protein